MLWVVERKITALCILLTSLLSTHHIVRADDNLGAGADGREMQPDSSKHSNFKVEFAEMNKTRIGGQGEIKFKLVQIKSASDLLPDQIEIRLELVDAATNSSANSSSILKLLETVVVFKPADIREGNVKSVQYEGIQLGIQQLQLLHSDEVIETFDLPILANSGALNDLFMLVMTCMIIVNTINMGAQLDVEMLKRVLKKPIGPGVGFFCQFVLMPLLSFLIGYIATEDKLFRLGLFVLGCCPGGTGSNFWTILLGGDINLSITMTFVSTVCALGMMPLWMMMLGSLLTDGNIQIPYSELMVSLMALILPVLLGMWIRWRWPGAGKVLEKIIVPFTLLTVLFILTGGVYINLFIFQLMTPLMIAAGFAVALSGYGSGAGLAYLFKLTRPQITAVSVETAFQNGSIAFVLLKISFPEPLGELASVAPVAQLLITGLPLWGLLAILKIYQRFCRSQTDKDKDKKEEQQEMQYEKVALERV